MSKPISDERLAELIINQAGHLNYTRAMLPDPIDFERTIIQEAEDYVSALDELRHFRAAHAKSDVIKICHDCGAVDGFHHATCLSGRAGKPL